MKRAEELLRQGCRRLGFSLSDQAFAQLIHYLSELLKWNRRINLIGPASPEDMVENHFIDSLTLLPLLDHHLSPGLMDVGSGAGFPGLPIKIACPSLPVILVEPRQKRAAFLRHLVRTLGLPDVIVLENRLEAAHPALVPYLGRMPFITSRAFSSMAAFLNLAEAFSAPDGKVLCMKGPRGGEELDRWQETEPGSPYTLEAVHQQVLPFSRHQRKLIVFRHCPQP